MPHTRAPLYSTEERQRRDTSAWTVVQGVLAPLQFVACLASLALLLRFLATGQGEQAALLSVLVKTALLYLIMLTGSIWEKVVFGHWLFAPAFYWEDVFSMLVLALHTAYLWAWSTAALDGRDLAWLALSAYAAYAVNAAQFLWKLRTARREQPAPMPAHGARRVAS